MKSHQKPTKGFCEDKDKYDKKKLKARIDVAMAAFLHSGKRVQREAPRLSPQAPPTGAGGIA